MDEKIIEKWIQQLSKEENLLKKSLKAVAILTELLKERGIKPILVGGRALEFYTLGGYATKDIDLVINGREYAKEALEKMGFKKLSGERHWYNTDLDLAIEIPDEYLAGSTDKLTSIEIDGMHVFVIGIEDLILDRLAAAKFWESMQDAEWAIKLIALHYNDIDFDYLKKEAYEHQVEDSLNNTIEKSSNYIKKIRNDYKKRCEDE